ncbi:MAG: MBL fold metallo-hydrolase [Candidatus Aenigmatarchaeota archaeon]
MADVKMLVEGFTSADAAAETGEEKTCPTITLIKDRGIVMVTDPGVLKDQKMLVDALQKENLSVSDVNFVFITHSHIDHYRNIGMFPKAKTLEYWGIWHEDKVDDWKPQFTKDIQIIKTPGHNYDGLTLLVKTSKGVIAICGDVFWKENYPKDDPYASDKKKLQESRKLVLKTADLVVPGHGKMYKVKK